MPPLRGWTPHAAPHTPGAPSAAEASSPRWPALKGGATCCFLWPAATARNKPVGGGAMLIAFEKRRSMVQSGSWACCLPERGRLGEEARLCRQRSRATPPHPANRARGARVRDGPGLDSGAVKATCQAVRATPSQGILRAVRAATGLWAGPCRLAGSWGPAEPLAGAPAGSLSRDSCRCALQLY